MYVCLTYEEEFNPSKGEFNPSEGEFNPSEGEFNPSEGEFNLSEGEFNPSEGEFNPSVAIGCDSNTPGGEVPYRADNHMCSLATSCPHPLCC